MAADPTYRHQQTPPLAVLSMKVSFHQISKGCLATVSLRRSARRTDLFLNHKYPPDIGYLVLLKLWCGIRDSLEALHLVRSSTSEEQRTAWFSVNPECSPLGLAVCNTVITTPQQAIISAYHIEIVSGGLAGVCNIVDIAIHQDLLAIQLRVPVVDLSVAQSTLKLSFSVNMCRSLPLGDDGPLLQSIIDVGQNSPYTSCECQSSFLPVYQVHTESMRLVHILAWP